MNCGNVRIVVSPASRLMLACVSATSYVLATWLPPSLQNRAIRLKGARSGVLGITVYMPNGRC